MYRVRQAVGNRKLVANEPIVRWKKGGNCGRQTRAVGTRIAVNVIPSPRMLDTYYASHDSREWRNLGKSLAE